MKKLIMLTIVAAMAALTMNAQVLDYGNAGKDSATRIWIEAEDFADFSDRFNFLIS